MDPVTGSCSWVDEEATVKLVEPTLPEFGVGVGVAVGVTERLSCVLVGLGVGVGIGVGVEVDAGVTSARL